MILQDGGSKMVGGGNKMVSCQKWELKRLFVFSDSWKKATPDFLSIEQKSEFFMAAKMKFYNGQWRQNIFEHTWSQSYEKFGAILALFL